MVFTFMFFLINILTSNFTINSRLLEYECNKTFDAKNSRPIYKFLILVSQMSTSTTSQNLNILFKPSDQC